MGITNERAAVVYLTWFGLAVVSSSSQISRCSDDTESLTRLSSGQRLEAYCNIETTERQAFERSLDDNWELQYLTLNIRHGDRSAVHHFYSGDWRDSSAPEPVDMSAVSPYIDQLRTFHLSPLSTGSHEQTVSFTMYLSFAYNYTYKQVYFLRATNSR
jgi:protein tyrosine phosphatase